MFYFNAFQFGVLWWLQVCPLKATRTVNKITHTFHSLGSDLPAGAHTAFTDMDGIYLYRGGEALLSMWIYAFRQVVVCRQETPINRFYDSCLEADSVFHVSKGTVIFFKGKYRSKALAAFWVTAHNTMWYLTLHIAVVMGTEFDWSSLL